MDARTRVWLMRQGFTAAIPREHCNSYINGCKCEECMARVALIAEHRLAGRSPFTASGAVCPKPAPPLPTQPWDIRAA